MIDPGFVDITDEELATISPYPPTMQDLERKIVELESNLQSMTNNWNYTRDELKRKTAMIEHLESYMKENHDYIDDEILEELSSIFGIALTKDYDVTITVRFSGTVTVPLNYDMDSLEDDLSANLDVTYYSGDVEADISEDEMNIDYTES